MSISIRIVVVLPAPFGPSRPYTAPRGTVNDRVETATKSPNRFVMPSIWMIGSLVMVPRSV